LKSVDLFGKAFDRASVVLNIELGGRELDEGIRKRAFRFIGG
jgi:hypothetical protein